MQAQDILALYDQQQRRHANEPGSRRVEGRYTVRYLNEIDARGWILYTADAGEHIEQVIDEEIAFFEREGRGFEWKLFSHDKPADLPERLQARGFELGEIETLCALDLNTLPAVLAQPVTHDVRIIRDADTARDIILAVQNPVFGETDTQFADYIKEFVGKYPDWLTFYAAYADGRAVSAAWMTHHKDAAFGGLWGGATLEAYRGRGIYTALVATRAQDAKRNGARFLTIDASDMSSPIVQKHGFVVLCTTREANWEKKTK
jgi:GNAT superfamily N-acetyltransferase